MKKDKLVEAMGPTDSDIKKDLRFIAQYFFQGLADNKNIFAMDYNDEEPDFAKNYGYYSGQAGVLNFCGREIAKTLFDNSEPAIDWDYYIDLIRNHSEDYEENWEDWED